MSGIKKLFNRATLGLLVAAIVAFPLLSSVPVHAVENGANSDIGRQQLPGDEKPSDTEECALEGFAGTLMCDATEFMASINDACFGLLEYFLRTAPLVESTGTGQPSSMFSAWQSFRNLANVMFIITFLLIIYSYVTSMGVNMYNIKKMLPRLIVAALLINISYYICGIAVDISNILGQTLISTIHALVPPQMPADIDGWQSLVTMLVYLTPAAAVAGPAVVNMHFAALAPIALMAAIALLVTVLVLLLRQALIVLFIVISPLAFAAMVLPGTNNLFEKWRSNFTTLLLLYPAVSIVFGGAYLASQAIMRVGAATIDTDPIKGPLL
ncbi:hypothetical protein I8H89_04305, partial [Candidatus Saccharibacteria bacterium]|nr:hypothetical protein [Candidatus Saccharibacteria bacterium]